MNNNLLVVRLRGTINVRSPVKRTLEQLHLTKNYRATIIPDTPDYRGMLLASKEYVAWCNVDSSTISKLLKFRAKKGGWKSLNLEDIKKLNYDDFDDLARSINEGKIKLKEIEEINPYFALSPPKGGFKRSTRRLFAQGGILGENPELVSIIDKMI